MAVLLRGGAVFLHIPKTGGSWVHQVLKDARLCRGSFDHKHADFDRVLANRWEQHGRALVGRLVDAVSAPRVPDRRGFRFCFVRHPLRWYESYWKFMQGRDWNDWGAENSRAKWHPNSVLNGLRDPDFNGFMRKVLRKRPGYASELLFAYTKSGIGFIGKNENLTHDLMAVLRHLGLPFDEARLRTRERVNVSKDSNARVEWDPELRRLATKMDLPALAHFDYLTESDREMLGLAELPAPASALHRGRF